MQKGDQESNLIQIVNSGCKWLLANNGLLWGSGCNAPNLRRRQVFLSARAIWGMCTAATLYPQVLADDTISRIRDVVEKEVEWLLAQGIVLENRRERRIFWCASDYKAIEPVRTTAAVLQALSSFASLQGSAFTAPEAFTKVAAVNRTLDDTIIAGAQWLKESSVSEDYVVTFDETCRIAVRATRWHWQSVPCSLFQLISRNSVPPKTQPTASALLRKVKESMGFGAQQLRSLIDIDDVLTSYRATKDALLSLIWATTYLKDRGIDIEPFKVTVSSACPALLEFARNRNESGSWHVSDKAFSLLALALANAKGFFQAEGWEHNIREETNSHWRLLKARILNPELNDACECIITLWLRALSNCPANSDEMSEAIRSVYVHVERAGGIKADEVGWPFDHPMPDVTAWAICAASAAYQCIKSNTAIPLRAAERDREVPI